MYHLHYHKEYGISFVHALCIGLLSIFGAILFFTHWSAALPILPPNTGAVVEINTSNNSPSSTASYYFNYNLDIRAPLSYGNEVVLTFPAGFDLSGVASNNVTVSGTYLNPFPLPAVINPTTRTITIKTGSMTGYVTALSITVDNVLNPSTAGFYRIDGELKTGNGTLRDSFGATTIIQSSYCSTSGFSLLSQNPGESTTYSISLNNFDFGSTYEQRIQFPDEVQLAPVNNADISVDLGSGPEPLTNISINPSERYISFRVNPAGGPVNTNGTVTITNMSNPTLGGSYPTSITTIDTSLGIPICGSNQNFSLNSPVDISYYSRINITTPLVSASTTYTISYIPNTNQEEGWKTRLLFSDDVDLSGLVPSSITVSGAPFDPPTITIDTANHYIDVILHMPSGDTGGNRITITIPNLNNPSLPGYYRLGIESYNPSNIRIDQGYISYTIVKSGTITDATISPNQVAKNENTYLQTVFTPKQNVDHNWTITYIFDSSFDISALTPGDVSMSGSNFSSGTTIIDHLNRKITYTTNMPSGDSANNAIDLYISSFLYPSSLGRHTVQIETRDTTGTLIDAGQASVFTYGALSTTATTPIKSASSTYQTSFMPTMPVEDGYYIKYIFPSTMDLSSILGPLIAVGGDNAPTISNITVDNMTHSIEGQLGYTSGNSNNNLVSIYWSQQFTNPSTIGDLPISLEIYDSGHTPIETLTGVLEIIDGKPIYPNILLTNDIISQNSIYTVTYDPSWYVDNNWKIDLIFPAGTDLSSVNPTEVVLKNAGSCCYNPPTVTVNNTTHTISLLISLYSNQSDDLLTITIPGILNASSVGAHPLLVKEYNDLGQLFDSGTGTFSLRTGGVSNIIPSTPTQLFTNTISAQTGRSNPTDLTDTTLLFSALFNDNNASDTGSKYQIVFSETPSFATIVYDSGSGGTSFLAPITNHTRTSDISISYTFNRDQLYYWKIRLWDGGGIPSPYSTIANFKISPLPTNSNTSAPTPTSTPSSITNGFNLPKETSIAHTSQDDIPYPTKLQEKNEVLRTAAPIKELLDQESTPITSLGKVSSSSSTSSQGNTINLCLTFLDEKEQSSHNAEKIQQRVIERLLSYAKEKNNEQLYLRRSEVLRYVIAANCLQYTYQMPSQAPFPDVATTHPDSYYIAMAKKIGIVHGYLDSKLFKPDTFISRVEALKVVLELTLGHDTNTVFKGSVQPYIDIPWTQNNLWYKGYVQFAFEKGIIQKTSSNTFRPNDTATLQDIIYFLDQALKVQQ